MSLTPFSPLHWVGLTASLVMSSYHLIPRIRRLCMWKACWSHSAEVTVHVSTEYGTDPCRIKMDFSGGGNLASRARGSDCHRIDTGCYYRLYSPPYHQQSGQSSTYILHRDTRRLIVAPVISRPVKCPGLFVARWIVAQWSSRFVVSENFYHSFVMSRADYWKTVFARPHKFSN